MQLGMIGLGRMGRNMVQRLLRAGHDCVVSDRNPGPAAELAREGAVAADSLADLVQKLAPPRAVWIMVPVDAVQAVVDELAPLLQRGDCIIDGGNSPFEHAIRRSGELAARGIDFLDAGTSGGVWGLERGYCLMIGGPEAVVRRLEPVFRALAPGRGAVTPMAPQAPGSTASEGYLHCGPSGAGHFVKMVHNGIEYGLMASFAEGLNILHRANVGMAQAEIDAETAPMRDPEAYAYDLDLRDITEVWRRGSVVASWLLDLTAAALAESPTLEGFSGRVSDSGEGRWTVAAAIDESVPAPVLSAALFSRFASRGEGDFAGQVLSAMRLQFGGHAEKAGPPQP